LAELAVREKELTAAKEALKAEIARFSSLRAEYEERIRVSEKELELKSAELESVRGRLESVQRTLQGRSEGSFVTREDVEAVKLIHAGRFKDKLGRVRKLPTQWGEIRIEKWDEDFYDWVLRQSPQLCDQ